MAEVFWLADASINPDWATATEPDGPQRHGPKPLYRNYVTHCTLMRNYVTHCTLLPIYVTHCTPKGITVDLEPETIGSVPHPG